MTEHDPRRLFRIALYAIAAVTLVRIVVLVLSPLDLYPDEAQYWWWAQTPDFGYFSKPPLIAWIVRLATSLFGDGEWAIRIASPLFHAGTALLVFGIARRSFNARAGLWSALAYLTVPGVSYSSGLVSTDVPLLFFWAGALYAFLRAMEEPGWRWPLVCGIAFGWGLMAKYAMLYFVLGAVVAALAVPGLRKLVFGRRSLLVLATGLLILAPNIAWNAAHGFPTVAHTEANADWSHARYDPAHILDFLGGQFGVFGPFLMAGFILALWGLARGHNRNAKAVVLAAFSAPLILLVAGQAFIAEANANWAATAYVAAAPLAVFVLLHHYRRVLLWASFALNGLAMAMLWAIYVSPPLADMIGQGNAFKRQEGWRELGQAVTVAAGARSYDAIAAANRSVMAELTYYARPRAVPLRMWDRDLHASDHFQMTMRLAPGPGRVLLVLLPQEEASVLPTFDSARRIGSLATAIGGHHVRIASLFDVRGFRGPSTTPLPN